MSALTFDPASFTPLEAQGTAISVAGWLERERFKVSLEVAIEGAPYRTTLLAQSGGLEYLVEAQGIASFTSGLQELASWLSLQRKYAQLYIAIATSEDTAVTGRMLDQMKKHGAGLLLVEQHTVEVMFEAANPALIVTPDQTLQYGHCKKAVADAVQRFNRGERIAGLRDMAELVEREMNALTRKLAKKGWITKSENEVDQLDFNSRINLVASATPYAAGRSPLVTETLKTDLHSFRSARNLVDHPVTSKREQIKREKQFPERMLMGPRLIAELVALRRKIR